MNEETLNQLKMLIMYHYDIRPSLAQKILDGFDNYAFSVIEQDAVVSVEKEIVENETE